jgi:hypothetical protein
MTMKVVTTNFGGRAVYHAVAGPEPTLCTYHKGSFVKQVAEPDLPATQQANERAIVSTLMRRDQRLPREIVQARARKSRFRTGAAFAKPEVYEARQERGIKYAIRNSAN